MTWIYILCKRKGGIPEVTTFMLLFGCLALQAACSQLPRQVSEVSLSFLVHETIVRKTNFIVAQIKSPQLESSRTYKCVQMLPLSIGASRGTGEKSLSLFIFSQYSEKPISQLFWASLRHGLKLFHTVFFNPILFHPKLFYVHIAVLRALLFIFALFSN